MSVSTERATLQVNFPKEKLEALRFYMNEKEMTVENELQNYMKKLYEKYVPIPTRRYLERNNNGQDVQVEPAPGTTTTSDRRRTERAQGEQEQEQTEGENQGMSLSM